MSSNNDVYVSLNTCNDIEEGKSTCMQAKEQIGSIYHAFADEDSKLPDVRLLNPFSAKEIEDFGEALRGDYKGKYHVRKDDIFFLPQYQYFEERVAKSNFDNLNIETDTIKFRVLAPFLIKAELKPGLAFAEGLLTLLHLMTMLSVFTSGVTFISLMVGGSTVFLLMTILHFWYGMSRYPSIWNAFVPHGLKGSHVDHNFSQIRDICSHRCNDHTKTNSQLVPFIITLPFTILFHANAFLITSMYFVLKVSTNGGIGKNLPSPVTASLFLSNFFMTLIWVSGGVPGMIFCTCTIFFNQTAYDSLLFNRNRRDYLISLVFGNFLIIEEKKVPDEKEISLTGNDPIKDDIEAGGQTEQANLRTQARNNPTQSFSIPSLLGAPSTASAEISTGNELEAQEEQPIATDASFKPDQQVIVESETDVLTTIEKLCSINIDTEEVDSSDQSQPEIFADESLTQHSDSKSDYEGLRHLITVLPRNKYEKKKDQDPIDFEETESTEEDFEENKQTGEVADVQDLSKKNRKKFFGISRRMFPSPRKQSFASERNFPDDEISTSFMDPGDVYLDDENHPGTMEWRNTISQSIHRFRIRAYTLRKHNWVMNQLYGKSFFVKDDNQRRRKLKRKEIKEHCKELHDKKLRMNSEISGILDDLKSLRKSYNSGRSDSDHNGNAISQTNNLTGLHSEQNPTKSSALEMSEIENNSPRAEKFVMGESYFSPSNKKSDGGSFTKDSIVDSSKGSSVSTLTESYATYDFHEDAKYIGHMNQGDADLRETSCNGETGSFRDAISGILECTPWIDNMIALRESGSMQKESRTKLKKTDSSIVCPCDDKPLKTTSDPITSSQKMNSQNEPYWRIFVEQTNVEERGGSSKSSMFLEESGLTISSRDLKAKKKRNKYPWRSDLQKKKVEKAHESRSHDKALSIKHPKRIITILKQKKSNGAYQAVSGGQLSRQSSTPSKESKKGLHPFHDQVRHKIVEIDKQSGWHTEPEVNADLWKDARLSKGFGDADFARNGTSAVQHEQREEQNFLSEVRRMSHGTFHYE